MYSQSPLPALDAWTASSLLQKAIRRGECEYAIAAAAVFHRLRGNAIWRRLTLIAFEDIGPADPHLCATVTKYATDIALRREFSNDAEVIAWLVQEMTNAPKNREADYLICTVKQAPFEELQRGAMAAKAMSERIDLAAEPNAPLLTRSLAVWMASGLNGGGPQVLSEGNLDGLMARLVDLGATATFASAAMVASRLTREPIVLMAPLLDLAIRQSTDTPVEIVERMPPSVDCDSLPSWVFDKHTRLGKAAMRHLLRENDEIRDCIAHFVPEFRALDVAAMAGFYADAISVKRRMVWGQSDELFGVGLRTDMTKIGTPEDGVAPITSVVLKHLDHLNGIRQRLRRSANPSQLRVAAKREAGQ